MTEQPYVGRIARAKINAFLRVLGRRDDGYHDIESLILPVSLHDDVVLGPANGDGNHLELAGDPDLVRALSEDDPDTNLAVRAVSQASSAWTPAGGPSLDASIRLTKRIPVAAGLGGGSADAAAALWAAADLWGVDVGHDQMISLGGAIGSDVPAMIDGRPVLARGRGERLEPVAVAPTWWVLVPLGFAVAAADAYRAWDARPVTAPGADDLLDAFRTHDLDRIGPALVNDLQGPVVARHPSVARAIELTMEAGALGAIMSGSGPTVAALARNLAHAERIAAAVPGAIVVSGLGSAADVAAPSLWTEPIRTARLRVDPMTPDDTGEVFAVLNDRRLHAYIGGQPDTLDETRTLLRGWASQRSPDGREAWCNWVLRTLDGATIGTVQATVQVSSDGSTRASIAWVIGFDHQGHGYATEAALGLATWLRNAGVMVLEAHIHPDHAASSSVARACGMEPTAERDRGEVVWRWVGAGSDAG